MLSLHEHSNTVLFNKDWYLGVVIDVIDVIDTEIKACNKLRDDFDFSRWTPVKD